jgi:hypothetical protein
MYKNVCTLYALYTYIQHIYTLQVRMSISDKLTHGIE